MPRNIDIGGYFDKLTRRAKGGRRRDTASRSAETDDGSRGDGPGAATPGDDASATEGSAGGGLSDLLKDVLVRGRTGASRTAERVRETADRRRPRRDEPPAEAVVIVEYSPRKNGDPDPGEVVWAWVPFEEDPEQGKDRPVVIIGRRGAKLVGIPLTTKRNDREAQLKLGTGGWDPKRRTSYARIWRLLDIDADSTRREGAVLDARRFQQLVEMVDRYYEVHVPTPSSDSPGSSTDWDY
jgi:hypothetical protein